ncbi:MAG: ABC transporter ATP-binding protein [Propionibacteriaceae bacterium]|nr:ABC transporter ATP-binding protein [Propionibacteriaceae bacterium]
MIRDVWLLFDKGMRVRLGIILAGSLILSAAEMFAAILVPGLMALLMGGMPMNFAGQVGEWLGADTRRELLVRLTLLVVGVFVLKDVAGAAFRYWVLGVIHRGEAATGNALLRRYLSASHAEHVERSTPVALRRLGTGVSMVYSGVVVNAVTIITELLTVVTMAIVLIVVMPNSALPLLLGVAFGLPMVVFVVAGIAKAAGKVRLESSQENYRLILRSLGSFKELRLRGTQEKVLEHHSAAALLNAKASQVAGFLNELPRYLIETIFLVAVAVATLTVASDDPTATAALGAVVVVAFRMLPSLTRLLGAYGGLRGALPAVSEVSADLKTPAPETIAEFPPPITFTHSIELQDLWFRYSEDEPWVLTGVNGTVPKGAKIALVGLSGAGKSTLADVVSGLQRPDRGRVLVDGQPILGAEKAWRQNVSIVPQDPYIAEATLRDNIVFDMGVEPDEKKVRLVASQAQLDDLVLGLPQGLDTILPERGVGLSGGQRQRIAIARALYRGTPFIVLDEATSALDNDTEVRIERAIAEAPEELTLVVIAHRLSTLRSVDIVAVLEHGAFSVSGTYQEVLGVSESFRRWVDLSRLPSAE